MAVTKQTYTATATWTAAQLADVFKQAFIDAGLMTDWFDSFLNTVENRVLRVVNDGTKTYGTVYYWFMFTTSGVFYATTTTWNATTHVPTGTQYIDYFQTATNVTTNHLTLLSLVNTTTCTLTRYTSAVNSGVSWFLVRNGSSHNNFLIASPTYNATSLIDHDKLNFNSLISVNTITTGNHSTLNIYQWFHLRSTYMGATAMRGGTTTTYFHVPRYLFSYSAFGNANITSNNWDANTPSRLWLPTARTNTHSGLAADYLPVFTSPIMSPFMSPLPSDFGIAPYYASSSMVVQDTLVVTAGTEEWEIIQLAVNATADASRIFFCARTV